MDSIKRVKLTNLFAQDNRDTYSMVYCLFTDVSNVNQLSDNLDTINLCLVDPSLIVGEKQLLVASEVALYHKYSNKLITKNLYSEILFNLSPNNNITWSLKCFGSKPDDSSLIAIKIEKEGEESDNPFSGVKGKPLPFQELIKFKDDEKLRQVYGIPQFVETQDHQLDLIVTTIAAKEVV